MDQNLIKFQIILDRNLLNIYLHFIVIITYCLAWNVSNFCNQI